MINKSRFRITHDKKLLRKIGKQWVTVSAMTLALLGGGALATSVVTHAASTNPAVKAQNTNNVKKQLNSNLDKAYQATQSASGSSVDLSNTSQSSSVLAQSSSAKGIMKTASLLHADMLNDAQKPNITTSSASAESGVASQSASSVSSKASSSNDAMNTLTLGTPAQQKRGWNFVQNGINNNDYASDNNVNDRQQAKPVIHMSLGATRQLGQTQNQQLAKYGNDKDWIVADMTQGTYPPEIKGYTDSDSVKDWQYHSGKSDIQGMSWRYSPKYQALEFTGGSFPTTQQYNPLAIGRFDPTGQSKSIKFDKGITNNDITYMDNFLGTGPDIYSIDLSGLDGSHIKSMQEPFQEDEYLCNLVMPSNFTYKNITNRSDIDKDNGDTIYESNGDFSLSGIPLLQSITFPSAFNFNTDTKNISGKPDNDFINDMKSKNWYQEILNTNYTLGNPADLMNNQSYTGTLVTTPNPEPVLDTVAFYTKHSNDNVLVSKATVSGADGNSVNISKDVPSDYQLANGNPNVTLTANTTDDIELTLKNGQSINNPYIPEKVTPDSANADVQYQYNNQTVNSDSTDYQGNNYQATDAGDNGTTISDNNEKGLPQGWHLANKDTLISYNNGKHSVAIDPNHVSDNVIYQYNGQNINSGYQLGSYSFGGNDYRATQAGNNGIDIKQANATGLRDGYTLVNADNNIQFDGKTKYLPVKPNQISDKGTLTLNYVESNGRTDKTVTLHPAIKGNVDDTLTLAKPLDYAEDNYTVPGSDFTWTIKPSNNEPSKTFTYNAPTAGNVTIQYYDTSTGHHLTQFDKTLTASDMEKAPYNLNWIVGNTVKIGIKGANDNAIDVLQAPAGYHFATNYPAESVTLPEAQSSNRQGLTLHVGLMLMARPVTPKKPSKPASSGSVTPVTPAKPSSASVAPSSKASSASSNVAPSSTSSVAPSSSIAPASQSVVPVVTPSSKASSARVSTKLNVASKSKAAVSSYVIKPVAHHHSHKNTNGNAHLTHLVHEATAKLSTVKSNVAKRNVLKGQLNDSKLPTHAKAIANEPTMGKSVATNDTNVQDKNVAPSSVSAKSVSEPSAPKSSVANQSTATTYANHKKLPQTGEANAHAGVLALIAMAAGAIFARFGKVFDRKHNE